MKTFYSHIVDWQQVVVRMEELEIDEHDRIGLSNLLEETLHSHIVAAVLDELDEKDRENFVRLMRDGDDGKIWEFLDKRVLNIENKIKQAADDLEEKIHEDIKEAKDVK
jgi:hypothetical protein